MKRRSPPGLKSLRIQHLPGQEPANPKPEPWEEDLPDEEYDYEEYEDDEE